MTMIHYYISLNKAGRKVMQDESSSVSQQVESLIKANGSVCLLYHLLRESSNKRGLFESAIAAATAGEQQAESAASALTDSSNDAGEATRKRKRQNE